MIRTSLLAAGLLLLPPTALACGAADARRVPLDGGGELAVSPLPAAPEVGRFFALDLRFCGDDAPLSPERLRLDAVMPAHGHGMNYRARVRERAAGRYAVDGLLFHMPGEWRVRIDFVLRERAQRVELDYEL